jgi:hypothetical protein
VEFVNKYDTEGIAIMHLTKGSDVDLDDLYRSGGCGNLNCDVVGCLKDGGNVKFSVEIIRVGYWFINAVETRYG